MPAEPAKIGSKDPMFSVYPADAVPNAIARSSAVCFCFLFFLQRPGEGLAVPALGNRLIKTAHIFIVKGRRCNKSQFRNLIALHQFFVVEKRRGR